MTVLQYLQMLPVTQPYGRPGLMELVKCARIKTLSHKKGDLIRELNAYLIAPNTLSEIWNSLTPFEKACVQDIVENEGYLFYETQMRIADQMDVEPSDNYTAWGKRRYFAEKSRVHLLFNDTGVHDLFVPRLKKMWTVTPYELTPSDQMKVERYAQTEGCLCLGGEEAMDEVIAILKLVNEKKLKTSKKLDLPTRSSIHEINKVLKHKEYKTPYFNIEYIKQATQTTRILALYQLLMAADLLNIKANTIVLGEKINDFFSKTLKEKAEYLIDVYESSLEINELEYTTSCEQGGTEIRDLRPGRRAILRLLSNIPVNEWINIEDFNEQVRQNERLFLVKGINHSVSMPYYSGEFAGWGTRWHWQEGIFIEKMFSGYLYALGLVDLVISDADEYEEYMYDTTYRYPAYFRLTPFGAYILGTSDQYELHEEAEETGLKVTKEGEIIVGSGLKQTMHELFFDRFAIDTKSIKGRDIYYKLNFATIVKLLDKDISLDEVYTYLEKYNEGTLPTSVQLCFKQWKEDAKKVRIKTVTIVESDDPDIMEELMQMKSLEKYCESTLPYCFQIPDKNKMKVKREIEKKSYFCYIEE